SPECGAGSLAIESLALLLFAQQRDRFLIKVDGADALLAFRRAEAEAVALSRELLPHSQSGSIEVHVTPAQPAQAARPATGGHSGCRHRPPAAWTGQRKLSGQSPD